MKVLGLKNLVREEGVIYYRKVFNCSAIIELPTSTAEVPIHFTIEMTPLGSKEIELQFLERIEYPLVPVIKQLKAYITEQDYEGKLL